jgi:anti-repressor protein
MNELIPVRYDSDNPTVSARDLHSFLEIGTEFAKWFERMCEYGFSDGVDFSSFLTESTGGRPAQDAALTIEMAKELCMLQRNEKGKLARTYFIQLEKDWNSPEKVMARALQIANKTIKSLSDKVQQDAPKVLFADSVAGSKTSILIRDLAKLLNQNGYHTGETRLFATLRERGYLICKKGRDYNSPTQKSMDLGLMEVKETAINHSDGTIITNKTPLITGKGQQYFIERFCGK